MQRLKFSVILICTVIVGAFISGCASMSIHQDYNPETDFSKFKTYGFFPIPAEAGIDQINAERLGEATKANLNSKGYTLSEKADFGVAFQFSTKTKTSISSYGYGYGYGYGPWGMGMQDYDVHQYDEGTLIIDIIDTAQNQLVWRGTATGTLRDNPSIEERTARINDAVAQILEQFPPEKGAQ